MTPAERVFWGRVKGNRLGVHFRRQHPTGPYVLDFVCLSKKIIVEIDGPWHELEAPEERRRTEFLESCGFRILRFTNDEIFNYIEQVMRRVWEAVEEG